MPMHDSCTWQLYGARKLHVYVCESTDIKDMAQDGFPHSFHHVQDKAKLGKAALLVTVLVCWLKHPTRKCSQKVPRTKMAYFGSLGWIPIIQTPFNSSCAALQ